MAKCDFGGAEGWGKRGIIVCTGDGARAPRSDQCVADVHSRRIRMLLGQMYKPDSVSEIKLDLGTSQRSILGCWAQVNRETTDNQT